MRKGKDRSTVLRFQADAGAGKAWGGGRHERGSQAENSGFAEHEGSSGDEIAGSVRFNR